MWLCIPQHESIDELQLNEMLNLTQVGLLCYVKYLLQRTIMMSLQHTQVAEQSPKHPSFCAARGSQLKHDQTYQAAAGLQKGSNASAEQSSSV